MSLVMRLLHIIRPDPTEYERCEDITCNALNVVPTACLKWECRVCGTCWWRVHKTILRFER